ncbi:MAG: DUF1704 domain-containing protein [Anaerolineae bacterium]|nr:DUF1704 domain-containing protein [Anaerolineae bacterium]
MIDLEHLHPLELEWENIEQSYRLSPYNAPRNRETEYKKVLTAYETQRTYNPQFKYQELPECPVACIRQFMTRLAPEKSPLEILYYEKALHQLLAIRCVQTHAPDVITGASCLSDGLPNSQLLAEAHKILSQHLTPDASPDKDIAAEQAIAWMQSALERSGIQEWRAVVFEPMNATMSVNRLDKQIRIRKGAKFSQDNLRRLLVHEIGVHVLRYENGAVQPIRLFRNSFTGSIDTEEGLAIYSEDRAGVLENSTMRKYAGRVIAAHLALSQSFFEVFQALVPWFGQEMAFEITARAKRGFTDTAQPGAHTKDIVYLRGYLQVKAHLKQHPEDYPLLFTGKVGLQHLPLVRELLELGIVTLPTVFPKDIIAATNEME